MNTAEPKVPHCHAGRDGDCYWDECPQLKDYKSYCPYAAAWEDYWHEEDGNYGYGG